MSTQHDRRRVLHSSVNSTPTSVKPHSSPNNITNKPIQARVDLSQFASNSTTTPSRPLPVRSPSSTNGSTNSTPTGTAQRPPPPSRSHVSNLLSSPNLTPSSSPSPFAHPSYNSRETRASVSQPSSSSSPQSALRQPPSPKARVRSPERERERTTPRAGVGAGAGGGGGGPTSATQIKAKVTSPKVEKQPPRFPSTVSYLPSSVSTRNIHSPSNTSSPSNSCSPTLSNSSTTAFTSSSSLSPLTSPTLSSQFPSSPYDSPSLSKSTLARAHSSATLNSSHRSPVSVDVGLLPPFIARSSVSAGATPTSSTLTSSNGFYPQYANDRSLSPLPLRSPPLAGAEQYRHPPRPIRKSSKISRPPSAAASSTSNSNSAFPTAPRHTRSHSTTSSSSVTSLFSDLSTSARPAHSRSMSVQPVLQASQAYHYQQPPVALWSPSMDKEEAFREEEDEELPEMEESSEDNPSRRESEEREKDAKVERKIADLEITNASLLSINKSLERLKVQQSQEIRDLRRKMRESRPLASIRPLPVREHSLSNDGGSIGPNSDEEDDAEDLTWEEMLAEDTTFSAIAGLLESLLKRGRDAIVWQPPILLGGVGRVLNEVEMMSSAENSYYLEEGDSGY